MTDIAHDVLAMPYTRVLRAADQGGFACEVLEFSGCFATGDTAEEAMENLEEAMVMWVEAEQEAGHDIPRPLVAGEYSGRMTLRIPPSLHERAALQAQIEGVSLNRLLSAAVASYTGEQAGARSARVTLATQAGSSEWPVGVGGANLIRINPETGALSISSEPHESEEQHEDIGPPTGPSFWLDLPEKGGGVIFDTDIRQ